MVWLYVWLEKERAPLIRNIISLVYHYRTTRIGFSCGTHPKYYPLLFRAYYLKKYYIYTVNAFVWVTCKDEYIYIFQTWQMLREKKNSLSNPCAKRKMRNWKKMANNWNIPDESISSVPLYWFGSEMILELGRILAGLLSSFSYIYIFKK